MGSKNCSQQPVSNTAAVEYKIIVPFADRYPAQQQAMQARQMIGTAYRYTQPSPHRFAVKAGDFSLN
jgi:hypothetical protein